MESMGIRDMNNLAFFKGKKVFLTGHTGFKGSWLSRILILSGAEVTGYALEAPVEAAVDAAVELEPPQALHDNVMRQIRKEKKPARRVWLPAAAIAAAAALVLLAGQAGILSLPGFDRENSVTVNVGSAAERIFERIEPEAGEPDPAAAEEAAALSAETQLDVLLLWGQGTPAELRATPYETTKTGARLYRVTGTLAQELLDHYAAALYAADSDFSDLPEQEEACVLVME